MAASIPDLIQQIGQIDWAPQKAPVQAGPAQPAAGPGTAYAQLPTTPALRRFDDLEAAKGDVAFAWSSINSPQMVPMFTPDVPCRGMVSALQATRLKPGYFPLLQDVRYNDGTLKARQPTTLRSTTGLPTTGNSAFTNTTGPCRALWSGYLSGTVYVVACAYNVSTGKVGIWSSTDGTTFTEVTSSSASAAYGVTEMTDTGNPIQISVVYEQVSAQDVLVFTNNVDQPRIYAPTAVNGQHVRAINAISPPSAALDYACQVSSPATLPFYGTGAATITTQTGGFSTAEVYDGYLFFPGPPTYSNGDVLQLAWATPVDFSACTQFCFLTGWFESDPNWWQNFRIQIIDSVGGTQTIWDPTLSNPGYYSGEGQANTDDATYDFPYMTLNTYSLQALTATNIKHVNGLKLTMVNATGTLTPIASPAIYVLIGGTATGVGSLYGQSPIDKAESEYTIAFYNSATFTESQGVSVIPATGISPLLATVGANPALFTPSAPIPQFTYISYATAVPYFNTSSGDLANGVDTLNVYRQDNGSGSSLFAFSIPIATWSGSAWAYSNSTAAVQYTFDNVSYLNLSVSRFAPDAYNIPLPVCEAMCWANQRLIVGGTNFYAGSEFGFPFRFRLELDVENGQPVARSGFYEDLSGESVLAFATPSGASLGATTIFMWTQFKTYSVSGFDGYSLSQPSMIMEIGCSAPGSVSQYKDLVFFIDNNLELRKFSYAKSTLYLYANANSYDLAPPISRLVVDDRTNAIPRNRLPWVQSFALFDRYYMWYSAAGGAQNTRMLGYEETIQGFFEDRMPAGGEACAIAPFSTGWLILVYGSDGNIYVHENAASNAIQHVNITFPEMMQEGFGNAFYGRLGAIADVQTAGTISGMTAASPIVVNQTAHQMVSGDVIAITAAAGMPGAIGQWYVDVVDANHYSLYSDPAFTVPSNGTSQAYTGGAVADYSMLITRNLKPNTVEQTTLDLCYNAAGVVWRWDNRFGVQPGSQGASCEINISAPLTAGSRIYSLVLEGKDAMPHADQ